MYIDRVIYPISSLGPGNRLVIWTSGCTKHCHECANPELWDHYECQNISVSQLIEHITKCSENFDGITITGGDPCEQFNELLQLISQLRLICSDIIVYTGYTFDEISQLIPCEELELFMSLITVLIEGRYLHEKNIDDLALRGSENQNLIFCNADKMIMEKYEDYLKKGRIIENVIYKERIISVGIHNKLSKER